MFSAVEWDPHVTHRLYRRKKMFQKSIKNNSRHFKNIKKKKKKNELN
jgi:hypothetical protein